MAHAASCGSVCILTCMCEYVCIHIAVCICVYGLVYSYHVCMCIVCTYMSEYVRKVSLHCMHTREHMLNGIHTKNDNHTHVQCHIDP